MRQSRAAKVLAIDAMPLRLRSRLAQAYRRDARIAEITPERLMHNIKMSRQALVMTEKEFLQAAAISPQLLYLSPRLLSERTVNLRSMFRLNSKVCRQVLLRRPSLLTFRVRRVYACAVALHRTLKLPQAAIPRIVLRCPQVLTLNIETMAQKLDEGARRFGVSAERYRLLAASFPALLVMRPHVLEHRLKETAQVLGMSYEAYLPLALRHPSGLGRRPQSRVALIPHLQRLARACGSPDDMGTILAQCPAALSYGVAHVMQRCFVKERGLANGTLGSLLTLPAKRCALLLAGEAATVGQESPSCGPGSGSRA